VHPDRLLQVDDTKAEVAEFSKQDIILRKCEEFLLESEAERRELLKSSWELRWKCAATLTAKRLSRIHNIQNSRKPCYPETEGIEPTGIDRQKAAGECLHCGWPQNTNRNHRIKDYRRAIRLEKRTAAHLV
jgi:hypothetical protein